MAQFINTTDTLVIDGLHTLLRTQWRMVASYVEVLSARQNNETH